MRRLCCAECERADRNAWQATLKASWGSLMQSSGGVWAGRAKILDVMAENSLSTQRADMEAIQHLKTAITSGKNWYVALLEAIGLWGSAEEIHDGRYYSYLIGGEAFDWLSLAERLCLEVNGLVPEEEKMILFFFSTPPVELSQKEFRHLIGDVKYRAYLNFLYGIVVEEALLAAVQEEVSKEQGCLGSVDCAQAEEEAYQRIYGADVHTLLEQFRTARDCPQGSDFALNEYKEFVYWLFQYRVHQSEKARVASDTKKALNWLRHQWTAVAAKSKSTHASAKNLLRA